MAEDMEERDHGLMKVISGICLERLMKTMNILNKDSQ
jgi:hypothetical protein